LAHNIRAVISAVTPALGIPAASRPQSYGWQLSDGSAGCDTSIEAALEAVKLLGGIGQRGCKIGGRFVVEPLSLDQPGTRDRRIDRSAIRFGTVLHLGVLTFDRSMLSESQSRFPP
jgi:hypothetical protein